jgi:hypothetical protein
MSIDCTLHFCLLSIYKYLMNTDFSSSTKCHCFPIFIFPEMESKTLSKLSKVTYVRGIGRNRYTAELLVCGLNEFSLCFFRVLVLQQRSTDRVPQVCKTLIYPPISSFPLPILRDDVGHVRMAGTLEGSVHLSADPVCMIQKVRLPLILQDSCSLPSLCPYCALIC